MVLFPRKAIIKNKLSLNTSGPETHTPIAIYDGVLLDI
jgi:hypothetical protein